VVDSVGLHQLVGFVESKFGIQVDPQELVPDNFASLSALVAFIEQKKGA
jgi:acyl carrier protein